MPDTLPPALWLVPLIVVLTGGLWLALGRYLEGRAAQALKKLRGDLRLVQGERRALLARAQSCSGRDPEPFRSLSARLREALALIRTRLADLEHNYIELSERLTRLKHNRWHTFFSTPWEAHRLQRETASLQVRLSQLRGLLDGAASLAIEIQRLPLEVATQARRLQKRQEDVAWLLAELGRRGLYGDTFEKAARLQQEVQAALAQIPGDFLEGETGVLEGASKETVARVYETVRANNPHMDGLLDQSSRWEADYAAATAEVASMRTPLAELEQALSNPPPSLDLSAEMDTRSQLETIAQSLQATTARLEVESMPLVAQEARKLKLTSQELAQAIKGARRDQVALEALLGGLSERFRDLSLRLAALGSKSVHPIRWEVSLERLTALNRQANALGDSRKVRSVSQVCEDLSAASQIDGELRELTGYLEGIERDHAGLLAILENPEYRQLPKWIQAEGTFVAQARKYAPENWSAGDDLASLPGIFYSLSGGIDRLCASEPGEAIPETELTDRLLQTRQLLEDHGRLSARLDGMHQHWETLQAVEARAREQLEALRILLAQARLIAGSNPFLSRLATQEIENLERQTLEVASRLDQPQTGAVADKGGQVAQLLAKTAESAARWLSQLNDELKSIHKTLADTLSELDSIARLDDPGVEQARRLLAEQQVQAVARRHGKPHPSLEEAVIALKQRSTDWQESRAVLKAFENVQQLLDTYHDASAQRQLARQELAALPHWSDRKRTWPPIYTSLEAERQDFDRLEIEWKTYKDRSVRTITLAAHFSGLASRYQGLVERVRGIASRRQQEQSHVEELDARIAESAEVWEGLLRQHRDNPAASQEIQDFLAGLDDLLEDIERGYLRGELDYDQVVQEMTAAQRRVRFFQVALDDEHALDSSGRVTRRQQG